MTAEGEAPTPANGGRDEGTGNYFDAPQPTGRTLVLLKPGVDARTAGTRIQNTTGMRTYDAREFGASTLEMENVLAQGFAVVLPRFNVAVLPHIDGPGLQMSILAASDEVREVRPEFYMYAIQDAVPAPAAPAQFADSPDFTWGLLATGAAASGLTGAGIRVAVLDTGLDTGHPDFAGRPIVTASFVGGSVQDVQGHGTHTAGTVAGPQTPVCGPRYGVAPDVELYIGKVLNDNGSGREGDILNGMNWAIDQKCVVISMSLGRATGVGEKPDPLYEIVGSAALAAGCLIVAAAGNESTRRYSYIAPVGAPANAPSIMAVAAVDQRLAVADFSCGGINRGGGGIDIAGPGVDVLSAVPRPRLCRRLQGTSMACPHVAGIAALWAQSDPALRGQALWDALVRSARNLGAPRDYGAGLVQAPGAVPAPGTALAPGAVA